MYQKSPDMFHMLPYKVLKKSLFFFLFERRGTFHSVPMAGCVKNTQSYNLYFI